MVGHAETFHLAAVSGRRPEAQKVLDQLTELSKQKCVPALHKAIIWASLGEMDQAFEWLEKAYEEHFIIVIKVHPGGWPTVWIASVRGHMGVWPSFQTSK